MTVATQLDETRQMSRSVKRNFLAEGGAIQFVVANHGAMPTLPRKLPLRPFYHNSFRNERDRWLLAIPQYESQWASAIGIAIAKMASLAWEVESDVPRRRKVAQHWLLNAGAGMGIFGWVPFLSMNLRSYLAVGREIIEIERATPANGSKVLNIHHLNPLRCRLTGNIQKPVAYLDDKGNERHLWWHQVMIISDMLEPTEGQMGIDMSATERAYQQIRKLAAIEEYLYEKVSGQRPLAMYFLGGAIASRVEDAIQGAKDDAVRKGLSSYMGASIVPVPGDIPLNLVTIPLAELPDGFNAKDERERADLVYANAIGLDIQDLNPALIGRQGLGSTGNQSVVLADKAKGSILASWRQQMIHNLNELALDDKTTFTFSEEDLRDDKQQADNAKLRAETRGLQIDQFVITPEQARNLAVDDGDLPREFVIEDITGGAALGDDEKPVAEADKKPDAAATVPEAVPETEEETKETKEVEAVWEGMY